MRRVCAGEITPAGGQGIERCVTLDIECAVNEDFYFTLECAQMMKSGAKSECFSSKMVFKWQEFHGIIDQGNREYFRSVLISGQPIKMFWWIDHLIVMFLITFSGHY